jgi:hypothetical protein
MGTMWDDIDIGETVTHIDLCLRNNADWRQPFKLNSYDAATNTTIAYNLTGANLRMQWKAAGGAVVFELSTENGRIIVNDPPNGLFTMAAAAADLWSVPAASYYADMLVINADTTIDTAFTAHIGVVQGDTTPTLPTQRLTAVGVNVATPRVGSP